MCILVVRVTNPSVEKKIAELRRENANMSEFISNLFLMHEIERKKQKSKAHGSNSSKHDL